MNNQDITHTAAAIESLLFVSGKPLSRKELHKLIKSEENIFEDAVQMLRSRTHGLVVVDDGTNLELCTAGPHEALISALKGEEDAREIGRAGLEVPVDGRAREAGLGGNGGDVRLAPLTQQALGGIQDGFDVAFGDGTHG